MKTKVAVVGVGYWGKKHVDEYTRLGCEVHVADANSVTAEECAAKFSAASSTLEKILADKEIRFVSVCVPNQLHFEIAKQCLLAGKNVLVEKPLVMRVEEGEELKKLAESKRLVLNVGHIFRFNNAIEKLREMVESKSLGQIYSVSLVWNNLEPIKPDRDIVFDLAPHPFDIINYVFGRNPDKISCFGRAFRTEDKEEMALITGNLGNTLVSIELSWLTPKKERSVTVVGSEKSVFIDALSQKLSVYDNSTKALEDVAIVQNNTIQDELKFFLNCESEKNKAGVETGISIVRMLEATVESMKENSNKR